MTIKTNDHDCLIMHIDNEIFKSSISYEDRNHVIISKYENLSKTTE